MIFRGHVGVNSNPPESGLPCGRLSPTGTGGLVLCSQTHALPQLRWAVETARLRLPLQIWTLWTASAKKNVLKNLS